MRKNLFLLVALLFVGFSLNAQTLEDVKQSKASVMSEIKSKKAELESLEKRAIDLQSQIEKLSGWMTGFGGNVGLNLGSNTNWVSNPNPNSSSSSLAIGLSGFANNIKEKTLWRNSVLVDKQWLDIDKDGDADGGDDGLFDNGVVDILNAASLYGYRVHPKFAITGLGELNTSVENFFKPGTVDIGVGGTWTPNDNLVVIVHPLNYHFAFSGYDNVESSSTLGCKLRAEYNNNLNLIGKNVALQSTFTSFLPYSDDKQTITVGDQSWEAGLFEYTWINKLTFAMWNGIGVNVGLGLRGADFEINDTQTFYTLGLGYTL